MTFWQRLFDEQAFPAFGSTIFIPLMPHGLSAGGVADEWVTQMLRRSDGQVFKKYSQMKLQMKGEALVKFNRRANEMAPVAADGWRRQCAQSRCKNLMCAQFVHSRSKKDGTD